jgi:RNA polymerase sigma-70 factor (ECF subfamily)
MHLDVGILVVPSEAGSDSGTSAPGHWTLRAVFREHAGYVWRVLRHLGVAEAELDDACQEVFVVVSRRLAEYEPRASMRSWLYGIARRVASQFRRRSPRRREEPLETLPERAREPEQVAALERAQARDALYAILDELRTEQREVYVLYEIEQLTMPEVAEALGCPVQTAYSRYRSARKYVQAEVQRLASHEPLRRETP